MLFFPEAFGNACFWNLYFGKSQSHARRDPLRQPRYRNPKPRRLVRGQRCHAESARETKENQCAKCWGDDTILETVLQFSRSSWSHAGQKPPCQLLSELLTHKTEQNETCLLATNS